MAESAYFPQKTAGLTPKKRLTKKIIRLMIIYKISYRNLVNFLSVLFFKVPAREQDGIFGSGKPDGKYAERPNIRRRKKYYEEV